MVMSFLTADRFLKKIDIKFVFFSNFSTSQSEGTYRTWTSRTPVIGRRESIPHLRAT